MTDMTAPTENATPAETDGAIANAATPDGEQTSDPGVDIDRHARSECVRLAGELRDRHDNHLQFGLSNANIFRDFVDAGDPGWRAYMLRTAIDLEGPRKTAYQLVALAHEIETFIDHPEDPKS